MSQSGAGTLTCAACRHEITLDDSVRTVSGRRFHSACIDAHRGDPRSSGGAIGVFARYIERFAGVLRR